MIAQPFWLCYNIFLWIVILRYKTRGEISYERSIFMKIGFDNEKYVSMQSQHILERISKFDNKLYLEIGGKLFDDYHASRVLPGFKPDSKLQMLLKLKDKAEVVIVISAEDIVNMKVRSDYGITYDIEVLRLIDEFQNIGLYVGSICLTKYVSDPLVDNFMARLDSLGIKYYKHYKISGYPNDVEKIISDEGFGLNDYIETDRPLVIITAPGPGSGKMATCLSQLFHEHKHGIHAGYAKFETFPVWNLPLNHPVNLAYEAATADLNDLNMIDPFHLEAYEETTVNYNRDIEIFPVLESMFQMISGECIYRSPTDMGVNMAGNCIIDDDACCEASKQEIIRRYYKALCDKRVNGKCKENMYKLEILLKKAGITAADRSTVQPALEKEKATGAPAAAIELPDGRIITGKTGEYFGACATALLNALKELAGVEHDVNVISPENIETIQMLKTKYLGSQNPRLHTDELLIALSSSASRHENAARTLAQLSALKGCDAHATVILTSVDANIFRKIGINITCEPKYENENMLYHKK